MNDTAEFRLRQWARLPPPEILAVVPTGPVPQIAPIALREAVEPVLTQRQTVGWRFLPDAAVSAELLGQFWAWRRTWTASWAMGPLSNLAALPAIAARLDIDIGPAVREALHLMCAAEDGDQELGNPHLEPLLAQIGPLARALAAIGTDEVGTAIVDDLRHNGKAPSVVRCWPPVDDEMLLAAVGSTSVVARPDGLAVVHGEPRSHVFAPVESANLTGDDVLVVDIHGRQLVLAGEDARPLGWLAPTTLLWHVESIPLVDVWLSLLRGLPEAATAAALGDTSVCFTCDLTQA